MKKVDNILLILFFYSTSSEKPLPGANALSKYYFDVIYYPYELTSWRAKSLTTQ